MQDWKQVEAFPKYEVNSLGQVRRIGQERVLINVTHPYTGYAVVTLYNGTRASQKTVAVHRLVAKAFLGPRPAGKETNHIDGNKANPVLSNLEYVTKKENQQHAMRLGLKVHRYRLRKLGACKHRPISTEELTAAVLECQTNPIVKVAKQYDLPYFSMAKYYRRFRAGNWYVEGGVPIPYQGAKQ